MDRAGNLNDVQVCTPKNREDYSWLFNRNSHFCDILDYANILTHLNFENTDNSGSLICFLVNDMCFSRE